MKELLVDFLKRSASPEYSSLILNAVDALYDLGVVSWEVGVEQIMALADQDGLDATLSRISTILDSYTRDAIQAQGVTVETNDLGIKTDILVGLQLLQNYSDNDQISMICEAGNDPVETMSELLALVTTHLDTDYHTVITAVKPETIEILHQIADAEVQDLYENGRQELAEEIKNRISKFMAVYPNTVGTRFVNSGITLGQPTDFYTKLLDDQTVETMTQMDDESPINILSIVIISNAKDADLRTETQKLMDEFHVDINYITKADVIVDQALNKVFTNG